jgi:DNA-binding GntR family transcriptional regulator
VTLGRSAGDQSLANTVFETIKRQIVEYRLRPETILTEAALAAEHDVSRAPAREALQRLAAVGFVRAVPRVGYIVTSLSVRDFDEIFALRMLLEPVATELAVPRLTAKDLDRLRSLARDVLDVPARPREEQGAALARLNATFHREIARIAGNQRMERTITGLLDELERVMHMLAYTQVLTSTLDEHSNLITTMSAGDAAAAAQLMRAQLEHDYAIMRDLAAGAPQSPIAFAR